MVVPWSRDRMRWSSPTLVAGLLPEDTAGN